MGSTTLIDLRGPERSRSPSGGEPPDGDEPVRLYTPRRQIYPQLAAGKIRTIKWIVLIASLAIYYVLPWLRWDYGVGAPNQAVLADFAGGRFYFFGLTLWPQEVYYITGLLILAALGLFLVTALFGRVWCGYACPQTVWTDLFIAVERLFEGDRNTRMRLDKAPWSLDKAWRKIGKHVVWLLIAFATGGAWILYWHDAPSLAATFFNGHAPATAYVFAGLLTFTTYALAGTMREQVCTYMCPWPRIQAALTDKTTLTVTYRSDRGEPRGAHKKGDAWEGRGDCIDCKQCVVVCPMGIDIRDGAQLECIACGLCIDACDSVMRKVGRPAGLVAYDTDDNVLRRAKKLNTASFKPFRARTLLYMAVLGITAGLMVVGLATRSSFEVSVLKDRSLPFVQLATGDIRNGYTLKLVNKRNATRELRLHLEGISGAVISVVGSADAGQSVSLPAEGDEVERFRVLVTAPAVAIDHRGTARLRFIINDPTSHEQVTVIEPFRGPEH